MWQATHFALLLAAITPAFAVDIVVDLGYATYSGAIHEEGVSKWLGMRYAAPPLGDLRFAAPQDPPKEIGIQNATENGYICLPQQPNDWTVTTKTTKFTAGEDCLYISVYAPTGATVDSRLPVMFFLQGGGFGSNSSPNWDPSEIVREENIVVVQFNYRVGAWGFLQSAEVKAGGSLNNGIKDQLKALEWVQRHICRFGGNPDQVVLDGVSAGGASVGLLMAANLESPPFVGGMSHSGAWVSMRTMELGQLQYDCLVKDKHCGNSTDTLACLRKAEHVMTSNCWFNPHIDGELYTDSMLNLFAQGNYSKLPTIWGSDANEGTKYNAPQDTDTVEQAATWLKNSDPTITDAAVAILEKLWLVKNETHFPESGRKWRNAANAIGDIGTHCIIKNIQDFIAADGGLTWNYKYTVLDPTDEAIGFGAWHTVDAYALWGPSRTDGGAPATYTTTNAPIIPLVRKYLTSFMRTLDPNIDREVGAPDWTTWNGAETRERLFIQTNNTKMEVMSEAQSLRCQIVRPMSDNFGKPKPEGETTDFDATLAATYGSASESTDITPRPGYVRRRL
ncbi:carboxylesterase [Drepanopeziza brunnea f. sp. 'multigermtubi' MB_m1]|uniref:Carboxylic ester hydrolase n=1 Tax=Marssonina brunnea f. sp. multigermtubi (strain MB_m1) TaxID=1072389 RepID=K1WKK6_MARBU|nr:carboxylesterase [Drepanopeziza brunnea f. sp. 'multigermtubi' MB_m1]EKD12777.1 carboxylesterase [Drepanopeziza brunnea f. sp. 'multigermtubi' MB_m1]